MTLKSIFAAACLLAMTTVGSQAEPYIATDDLKGTIWAAKGSHTWTSIDQFGKATVTEADALYIKFREQPLGADVICIHWWNEEDGYSVVEYALVLPAGENTFAYTEVGHSAESGFPGMQGSGHFTLLSDGTASFTQMGRTLDGQAGAFAADLVRVDEEPQTPIPHTWPAM